MPSSLKESLNALTVPALTDLAAWLPGAKLVRKGDLIERIVSTLLGPEVNAIWSVLDTAQREAVTEAVHHPLGEYSAQRVTAKYGSAPPFAVEMKDARGAKLRRLTAIGLFIHYFPELRAYGVPPDLRAPAELRPAATADRTDLCRRG